jgi:hypothetical protein
MMGKKVVYKMAEVLDKSQVLCSLEGLMAIAGDWTRNDSNYSNEVYQEIENSDDFKEMIANSSFYIGLDHPEKPVRSTIISKLREAAAICRYYERDLETGEVYVVLDILDTPYGRIANTLARYGSKLGISTRCNGDQDEDGYVVEGTVIWYGADLVTQPSQGKARLRLVLEEGKGSRRSIDSKDIKRALSYVKGKKGFESVAKSLMEALNKQGGNSMKKVDKGNRKAKIRFKRFGTSGESLLEGMAVLRDQSGEDYSVVGKEYNPESGNLEVTTNDGVVHEFEKEGQTNLNECENQNLEEGTEEGTEANLDNLEDLSEDNGVVVEDDNESDDYIDGESIDLSVPVDDLEEGLDGDDTEESEEYDGTPYIELQEAVSVGSDGETDVLARVPADRGVAAQAGRVTKTVPKPGYDQNGIKKPEQVEVGKVTIAEDGYVMMEGIGATKGVVAKVKGRRMNVYVGRNLVEEVTLDKGENLLECFKIVSKDYKRKKSPKK